MAAGGSKQPGTIYEMLLWLYGLGQTEQDGKKKQLEDYIGSTLSTELKAKFTTPSVSTSISRVTQSAKELIQEVCKDAGKILKSIKNGQKETSVSKEEFKDEISKLKYPETSSDNGQKLYNQFLYYLTCCYWQLEFLYKICGVNSAVGGWAACHYGNGAEEDSENCKTGDQQNHDKRCKTCSSTYKGCLQAFLTEMPNGGQGKNATGNNIYTGAKYSGNCNGSSSPCYIPPMGFDQQKLPPGKDKSGYYALHGNLNSYFSSQNNNFPKMLGQLKLLELLSTATTGSPSSKLSVPGTWTVSDLWVFFSKLDKNGALKSKLKTEIQKQYPNGFKKNGSSQAESADYKDINDAFKQLLFPGHGNNHPSTLLSLGECDGSKSNSDRNNSTNKCGKYLYGLFSDPFHHVLEWFKDSNTIELLTFDALKEFARKLKEKLTEFKNGLENNGKECVKNNSCKCISFCDDTHTVLYRHGFTFYSPMSLAVMKKKNGQDVVHDNGRNGAKERKCSDLKEQLDKVTAGNSPLDEFTKLVEYVPPRAPLTIYEMLLWLHGLGQQDKNEYKSKLEGYIGTTLNGSLNGNFPSASTAITSVTNEAKDLIQKVCKDAGGIIVSIKKGENNKDTGDLNQELQQQPFIYDSNDKKLYDQFLYYLTACYWQLRFLCTVCGVNSAVGGWAACHYGKQGPESSDACTTGKHNQQRCQQCSSTYKGCLQAFLTEGSEGGTGSNIYHGATYNGSCNGSSSGTCPIPPMGFDQQKLPQSSINGDTVLKDRVLKPYIGSHSNNFPKLLGHLKLLELLGASTSTGSPSTLKAPQSWIAGDLWAFFCKLWELWKQKNNNFKTNLKTAIEKKYDKGFQKKNGPTQKDKPDFQDLNEVFTKLLFPGHNNSNHPSCLRSLYDCGGDGAQKDNSSNKCGKYLYSLFYDPFHHVLEWFKNGNDNIELLSFPVLQELAKGLKQKLQTFKNGLEDKQCVKNYSSCPCIVWCDDTHAELYKNGFTFYSPKSLAVIKIEDSSSAVQDDGRKGKGAKERKCSDLRDQLGKVTAGDSALTDFIGLVAFTPKPPKPAPPRIQARAESTDDPVPPSSPTARPVAAKPAATKPATSKPAAAAPAVNGVKSANTGPGAAPPASGTGTGSSGVGTTGPTSVGNGAQGPPPPPPPGPAVANQAVTTPAVPTSQGVQRSDSPTGTVKITHFHKDAVVNWKNLFKDVLKELVKVTTKATTLASAAAVKATTIAAREINAHHSSLLEPPCNVKECLEWLDRVCTNGNKDCQCQQRKHGNSCTNCMAQNLSDAVDAILPGFTNSYGAGNNTTVQSFVREASALFNAIKGPNYQPAYKLSAKWPTCGPATGGTTTGAQCRGCQKTDSCQCSTTSNSKSCDGTCCHRCDIRVCAGIFIAMVPALERALRELRDKLNGNYWTKIHADPVKGFLQHLGYEENDLNTTTQCNEVRSKLSSSLQPLGTLKSSIKKAFEGKNLKGKNNSTHPCYFQVARNSTTGGKTESSQCAASSDVSPADPSTASNTPTSIREMLLWLMGLPYCEGYKQFVEKLKEKSQQEPFNTILSSTVKSPTRPSTAVNTADYFLHRQYSLVIFQLPVLFFAVESDVSYLRDTFCQFAPEHNRERLKKIPKDQNQSCNNNHVRSFQYPCDGDKLCAMFYDYSYKVHLQLRFLLTMCKEEGKNGGWKQCKYAAPAATSSAARQERSDCRSKHNLLCSCPTQRRSRTSTTVSNSCRQLLREFLMDCRNKDPKKGVNQDARNCPTDSSDAADHSATNSSATRNIFQACSLLHVSMGFRVPECDHKTNDCCTLICQYTGDNIKAVLSVLVDESKGPSRGHDVKLSKPLSVVTQWMIALQGQEPRSLGDILDLFRELCGNSNKAKGSTSALGISVRNGNNATQSTTMASMLSQQLGELLNDKYADYSSRTGALIGTQNTAQQHVTKIQVALYNVLDVMHHRTQPKTPSATSLDPNLYSLVAIMLGCQSGLSKTCTAYVKSLSYGLYKYYTPEFYTQKIGDKKMYSDHVLDWLFKWCTELYKKLKELKERIVKCCSCCLEGGNKKDHSQCTSIVACCQCPPELYRCGLVFGDPKTLSGNGPGRQRTPKKCTDFIDSVSAVLSTSAPLFRACEAIMTVVYHVLLMASKNRVHTYILKLEDKQKHGPSAAQLELIEAFHRYVASAMHCSKRKLMETFLRPLSEGYNYQGCDDKCHKKDVEVSVSASSVITITAVIPQYTAPPIDPYHYRVMRKIECCEDCKGEKSPEGNNSVSTQGNVLPACYTFSDALDFHVRGANCILPVPSNLRSAVDWILRITVGNTNGNNKMIQHLSGAIKSVLKHSGLTDTEVNALVTALVEGLRKFVGYNDKSDDVIGKVGTEKQSVQAALQKKIGEIDGYLKNSAQFSQELGIALQKAMFTVAQNGDKKSLKCVIGDLKKNVTATHTDCNELKCTDFKPKYGRARHVSTVLLPDGLSVLCDFFDHLQYFAKEWNSIGQHNGGNILQQQKTAAMNAKWTFNGSTGSSSSNGDYFNKLHQALENLGNCTQKVNDLNQSGGVTDSAAYRKNITALITGLKAFNTALNGSDPVYAVKGAEALIKKTISKVEAEITKKLKETAELSYTLYVTDEHILKIGALIFSMKTNITQKLDRYKSHLDDLKQLCQWLYRMGQLYAHGLKGFVESLVSHLQYIYQLIVWIEALKNHLNIIVGCSNIRVDRTEGFFSDFNRFIGSLLASYAIDEQRRQFLRELRLLALDRYTLQVWEDNKEHIKDWITFEGGIVKHSDLEAVKTALQNLTGVAFDSNTATVASAPAPAPPSASHRIHDFHAICVLQKFSYEAPITMLEKSLKELRGIQGQLSEVKKKCNNGGALQDDTTVVQPFCTAVTEFLKEPYGIYSFAKFVHTIMGPNIFSAVIVVLEELKNKDHYTPKQDNNGGNLDRIRGILEVMTAGLDGENNKDHYTLKKICEKLEAFISTLKREYIFSYPVVCGIESDKDCKKVCPGEPKGECCVQCSVQCSVKSKDASLACSTALVTDCNASTPSHTSATSTVSLTSSLPLLCAHCHLSSSICSECIPLLARIFITLVPILYPQLCYLAYQCRLYWCDQRIMDCNPLSSLLHTFGWPKECLSDYYIGIDVRAHGRFAYWLLCTEKNSLRLLCQDFTEDFSCSPFNTDSPLFKLYHLCLAYYRCRRTVSLTDSKSTTPVMPTSLREILRFFVYLPFSAQFQSLQYVLRSYCSQSCVVNFSDTITTLMMSSAMSAVLLQLIECPQGMFLRFFDDIYTNKDGLYLDSNTETLFYQLCDLSVTLYRSLKFLSLQCGTERSLAGWKDCRLRGVKRNTQSEDTDRKDISKALDTQQLDHCASHLCECSTTGAKDSSTTCSVPTIATPMCLNSGPSITTTAVTPASHTTCSLPLLRYLTDGAFFHSTLTVQSALRKVCLNDSCQEMLYRHMAPRGWEKEFLQCEDRDEQQGDRQLEVCDEKACYTVCHLKDCDHNGSDHSNCGVCCSHPCRAQCCVPVCSTLYGHHLFHLLRNIVGHEHDADPLLQFTRYMVAIAAWPPDSLAGYMTFMLRFSDQLRKEKRDSQGSVMQNNTVGTSALHGNTSQKNGVNSSVLYSLECEISLFPGEFDPNCLIEAFLNVTHCEHNNGATSSSSATPLASHSTATSSLASSSSSPSPLCTTSTGVTISVLRDCQQCQRLLRPLDYEVYDLYLPMYARRYLTWMLHFGPRLHRGMRALEKEFRRHIGESSVSQSGACSTDPSVTQSGASGSTVSSGGTANASVLQCPFALPELHAAGLHFWDRKKHCSVTCECLLQRLQCSLKDSSPLADFLRQCDSFLWSVRKPFYWLTMALWIVATVYLLFVHLWRLDSWRLLSHVIRSRASHLIYPKVLLAAELDHSYEQYYAPR